MFKGQGVISKLTTLSDRTIRIQIDCQEQGLEAEARLFQLRGSLGHFVFNEAQVKDEDVPVDPIEFPGSKSLSERLRNVLYVLHEKQSGTPEDFEAYRHKIMERLIRQYRNKIEEVS